jgi:hypothetical protein
MPGPLPTTARFPLGAAVALYAIAFLGLASPWLLGAVAIPYDTKSQFYPQLVFLARSLAAGQSPFWTPNVFAGWPQIADPQSLIFSPFHVAVALLAPAPSTWLADAMVFALLFAGGLGVILLFRDRGWHVGGALVAALAFSFGGSAASRIQHVGQIESLAFLPLALWLLPRALERGSWPAGAGAGLFAAFIVLGRDQVALLEIYVLIGAVVWHWSGAGWRKRLLASFKPLLAGGLVGLAIIAVPVILTALLAADSNRPEIGYEAAGRGSLHPANLLMLAFADVFGASDFQREFWGPPGFPWHRAFGQTELYVAQNMGQIYCGALVIVALLGFGVARGQLWARDIRFFSIAMALCLLYALGRYTPAFYLMYELLPGVALYRRPADATFVLCALLAMIAGYLVHRSLNGTIPAAGKLQRGAEVALSLIFVGTAMGLALLVGTFDSAVYPIAWGIGFAVLAIAVLALARRVAYFSAWGAATLMAAFTMADFAWNNAPNQSTGLPPAMFDALRPDTTDETITLLKSRLRSAAAPDHRDRVELIGIDYHWPNIGLIHDFDHLFGHNPLRLADFVRATAAADTVAGADQRQFTPLMPSYRSVLEDLFGVRLIATGVPIEKIDSSLRPNDLNFIARTKSAYVYENPRALPRVLLATEWRQANFDDLMRDGGWPDVDPRRTVLLQGAPTGFTKSDTSGTARIAHYRNTDIAIDVEAPGGGVLVLNDVWHPWWQASVDGVPADILKANVLFRAVVVPPGRHVVRFTFHPFAGAFAELGESIVHRRKRAR